MIPKINFIILTAGSGYKMKSYEPRSMLKFNKIPLIIHQIKEINKLKDYGWEVDIFVVTGYQHEKIEKRLAKEKVTVVYNENYQKYNQGYAVNLVKNKYNLENMFLIHGDIFFECDLGALPYFYSFLLYDEESRFKDKEVGVNIGDKVGSLAYGVKPKWCQMAYFSSNDMGAPVEDYMITHEIINSAIDNGSNFQAVPFNGKIFEIDRIKEYRIESFNFN